MSDFENDNDPALVSYTTRAVINGAPVLEISHDEEGWQFHAAPNAPGSNEPLLVSLDEVWKRHPGTALAADLPRGWKARRPTPDVPWEYSPLGPEDYADDDE